MKSGVIAKFNEISLDHRFFDYIGLEEKRAIVLDMMDKKAFIVSFEADGKEIFGAVFDIEKDSLHVRQVGGNFPRLHKTLFAFTIGAAQMLGKNFITLCTKIRGVEILAKKRGFHHLGEDEYFYQVA